MGNDKQDTWKDVTLTPAGVKPDTFYEFAVGEVPSEQRKSWRLVWTGEKRPPRAEEFYLSGAVVEGYVAKADMDRPYHIARVVPGKLVKEWRPL